MLIECSGYVGFFTQVDNGTWALKYNYEGAFGNSTWLSWHPANNYPCANTSNLYSTGLFAGNSVTFADPAQYDKNGNLVHAATPETITIANAATASLYCYTPYVGPATITGYSGSYNFVYYYQLWFGSTQTSMQYAWNTDGQGAYIDSGMTEEYNRAGVHAIVAPGGTAYLQVNAINTGYATWSQSIVHLGTSNPTDRCSAFSNSSWISCNRIAMQQSSVIPGGEGTFDFSITAPQTPGSYTEFFNLVADGVTWMYGPSLYFDIDVVVPAQSADPNNTLTAGETLTSGQYLLSPDLHNVFAMQTDGNVVLYNDGTPSWNSGTHGYRISELIMQGDGNLVLYGTDGVADWSSGTAGNPGAYFVLQTDGSAIIYSQSGTALWSSGINGIPNGLDYVAHSISSTSILFPGQLLSTANRNYQMIFQDDGNLVVYYQGQPLWSSGTAGKPSAELDMQSDGNLVIYASNGQPLWSSDTAGRGSSRLIMQDDGNLVIYNQSNGATWSSGTNGKE